ncbi:alpha-L-fucosidase [Pontiella agarivorans]|uniref:alpha-L-fucosidase n=1 Tax=Pontiella agarivorans TaxID=3038953 RepID=A0ABU5MWK4_9BACT|nr:alpha-L-fucosidase [Pontiella agarivorans]MDZ8118456.1 alpha-L-fucosidase [Pontiella agarivorans]
MKYMLMSFIGVMFAGISASGVEEAYTPDWESLKRHQAAPEWFQDAKLGVYFHWGLYSIPASGGEWYPRWMYTPGINGRGQWVYDFHQKKYGPDFQYHDFIPMWKAEAFDAAEWVELFEEMGAKYVGALAEHHDGFSLWDSTVNPWNAADMGPRVDIVGELQAAAKKRDLKFMATFHHGFHMMYYPKPEGSYPRPKSNYNMEENPEFTYPKGGDFDKLYGNMSMDDASAYWLAKLKEVVDQYCPDYMWFDFGQKFISEEQRQEFLAYYFNKAEQAGQKVMVNTKGTFFPDELAIINVERATLPDITDFTWVSDFKLGPNWSFNASKRTAVDPNQLLRILAELVSKNGTMILNVSPMAYGTLPEEQVESMKKIGAWLKRYGESIYETRPFVVYGEGVTEIKRDMDFEWNTRNMIRTGLWDLNAGDIRYTRKGNTVYAIQLGWPGAGEPLMMKAFANEARQLMVKTVSVLGSDEQIQWKRTVEGLLVHTPKQQPAEADAALVYKLELDGVIHE